MRYKIGLIIGRFQPFHKGHLYLVKKSLEVADELIIGVGSANVTGENNPFSFKEREKHIEASLKKHNILNKVKKIVPIVDYPEDDDFWLKELKKVTGKFDVVISNNDWVIEILKDRAIKTVSFPFFKRHIYEGVKIRKEIKNSKKPNNTLNKYLP